MVRLGAALVLAALLVSAPVLCPAQPAAYPFDLEGRVVKVVDGDTITILDGRTQRKIRLNGIDAPEMSQAYGRAAKDFLASLVAGRNVTVTVRDTDRYGRYVGDVSAGGESANAKLVAAGYAWRYVAYSKDASLAALEKEARAKRLGLWADPSPVPPWQFRQERREKSGARREKSGARRGAVGGR